MQQRKLIVTHHAPDLDAIGAVWVLKRFDTQHYGTAKVAFTDPGTQLSPETIAELQANPAEVTHVDTGGGEFDHHQPGKGQRDICATSLVYDYVCQLHPDLLHNRALQAVVAFTTDVDHFGEIYWPDAANTRYFFMIHELIRGLEFQELHTDESQLHFGMQCLDSAYAVLNQHFSALQIIEERAHYFGMSFGKAMGIETNNDDVIKVAQRQGVMLVIRKDPDEGIIRIKCRPDCPIDLKALSEKIAEVDKTGYWFYHPSGKMLLNGSRKSTNQQPSPLTVQEVMQLVKETYT